MSIDLEQARDSRDVGAGTPPKAESPDTTHYSVIDGEGNIVATSVCQYYIKKIA